jgi:anti-sigma28 factor (negative regulator of flagellin synthesis)
MQINGFSESSPPARMSSQISQDEGRGRTAAGFAETNGAEDSDGVQLSKLSSVLNGLESGASAIRRHVLEAMRAVRTGTYEVDAVALGRRIVGEALRPA